MLEWLKELITQGWDLITPIQVVYPTERGVIYRMGKLHREIDCGWHWKWPAIETADTTSVAITTMSLPSQTLTTKDGKQVGVSSFVRYAIKDVKPYFTEISDRTDVLHDSVTGAVESVVVTTHSDDLLKPEVEKAITKKIRDEVNQYGFKIYKFTFAERGFMRTHRIMLNNPVID